MPNLYLAGKPANLPYKQEFNTYSKPDYQHYTSSSDGSFLKPSAYNVEITPMTPTFPPSSQNGSVFSAEALISQTPSPDKDAKYIESDTLYVKQEISQSPSKQAPVSSNISTVASSNNVTVEEFYPPPTPPSPYSPLLVSTSTPNQTPMFQFPVTTSSSSSRLLTTDDS